MYDASMYAVLYTKGVQVQKLAAFGIACQQPDRTSRLSAAASMKGSGAGRGAAG